MFNWHEIDLCIKCKHRLTNAQVYFSKGICPFCKNECKHGRVDTEVCLVRYVLKWKYWVVPYFKLEYFNDWAGS
jgi:hypothetical protein